VFKFVQSISLICYERTDYSFSSLFQEIIPSFLEEKHIPLCKKGSYPDSTLLDEALWGETSYMYIAYILNSNKE